MKNLLLAILVAGTLAACGADNQIQSCASAIGALDEKNTEKQCGGLSELDQKKATELATKAGNGIVFLPPYEAKKARDEAAKKGEPVWQPKKFEEVRELAYKGNYQAQRNLAYGYSSAPYAGQDKNPMLGCAWRIVIIKSGNEKVDETDIGNHKVYCDKLDKVSRDAAEAQAIAISRKIKAP